jgi:ankyrin repeat protein
MTPLFYACAFNKTELMALAMMDAGANVNALDGHGQTPLIRAVQNRNERIIDSLLSHGADATISTSRGATPLILLADPIPQDEAGQSRLGQGCSYCKENDGCKRQCECC